MFSSCSLDLGGSGLAGLNTTERLDKIRSGGDDPLFIAQYFQYGRYLLLAAARENTLAFNNHNIWLNKMEGRWDGRWTLNINLQECYWPVENTNLPQINESLLKFTENLAEAGARTASELYGCRGWCAHHGTDVWFNTAPTCGDPRWATWPLGGAWLMQQSEIPGKNLPAVERKLRIFSRFFDGRSCNRMAGNLPVNLARKQFFFA